MPPISIQMIYGIDILLIIKYALGILLVLSIILAPSWIARQNGHGKPKMHAIRMGSWVLGWSIIAWMWSLFWATKK